MTTIPGRHLMTADINDPDERWNALVRDYEEAVAEIYNLREKERQLRHWARLWKAAAWLQREKRRLGV